ncbi:hypothetical protein GTPT_1266 [Tatumella ptyseos ATCC 33301]|uniref:Uncharacterized protein n=1 Tax=Tatumella ptyseos ATCC 33301 TaxID=1005995 RepID=A0A085JJT7_9GAMM|nr:hypothetical protein [Tatumella ptyseos]KFD20733.1 hypothetical protein GTPT_1266 [Tatumella ptyseos ATCC 33301]
MVIFIDAGADVALLAVFPTGIGSAAANQLSVRGHYASDCTG